MKEYICKVVTTENGAHLEMETELIHCEDCNRNLETSWVDCELLPQMFGRSASENYCSLAAPKEEGPNVSKG